MLTIHKFAINKPVLVPKSAALLKVAMQGPYIFAWYCIDTDEKDTRIDTYHTFGTGREINCSVDIDYVDTVFENTGYVWHIYVETHNE